MYQTAHEYSMSLIYVT